MSDIEPPVSPGDKVHSSTSGRNEVIAESEVIFAHSDDPLVKLTFESGNVLMLPLSAFNDDPDA